MTIYEIVRYVLPTPSYWRDYVRCYYCNRKRPWWWPWFKVEVPMSNGWEPPEPSYMCRGKCIGDPGSRGVRWSRFLYTVSRGRIDR